MYEAYVVLLKGRGGVGQATLERLGHNRNRAYCSVDSERRGLWTYYFVLPDALGELAGWLG